MGPLGVAIPLPRRAARKRFAQIAQLVEQGTENPRVAGSIPALGTTCGHSSSGRAPPCQGGGSEFEPRSPLQNVLMKDATQKTPHKSAAFSHIMRHFWNEKVAKTRFFRISVLPRERRHFEDAPCQICGLVWFEHRGLKKNKKAGHRSAPYVGADGGLFRFIGAYVAFASSVYHSLVVLVIAFS